MQPQLLLSNEFYFSLFTPQRGGEEGELPLKLEGTVRLGRPSASAVVFDSFHLPPSWAPLASSSSCLDVGTPSYQRSVRFTGGAIIGVATPRVGHSTQDSGVHPNLSMSLAPSPHPTTPHPSTTAVRGDIAKGSNETFFRKVKLWKGEAPPVFVSAHLLLPGRGLAWLLLCRPFSFAGYPARRACSVPTLTYRPCSHTLLS